MYQSHFTHDGKLYYLQSGYYSWDDVVAMVLNFEKHVDLQINQSQLPAIPDYFKKRLGDIDGQDKDYGYKEAGGRGIHLKVYGSGFYKIHWDVKDPNSDLIGHLIYDAPHWGVALLAGIISVVAFSAYVYKNRKKN